MDLFEIAEKLDKIIELLENLSPVRSSRPLPTFISIKDASLELGLSENAIRWLIFKKDPRLEECILRNSRRTMLHLEKFKAYLDTLSKETKKKKGKI